MVFQEVKRDRVVFRSLVDILGYRLKAIDDEIGLVEDFYIDDYVWAVRHLVADIGKNHTVSSVLISPAVDPSLLRSLHTPLFRVEAASEMLPAISTPSFSDRRRTGYLRPRARRVTITAITVR